MGHRTVFRRFTHLHVRPFVSRAAQSVLTVLHSTALDITITTSPWDLDSPLPSPIRPLIECTTPPPLSSPTDRSSPLDQTRTPTTSLPERQDTNIQPNIESSDSTPTTIPFLDLPRLACRRLSDTVETTSTSLSRREVSVRFRIWTTPKSRSFDLGSRRMP